MLLVVIAVAPLCGCAGTHGRTDEMRLTARPTRTIEIELLALDLDTCGRCTGTERNLEGAVAAVSDLFREAGTEVRVTRRVIRSAEEAIRHRLVSSPTIRLDGRDIALELRESDCGDCGDLCGCAGGVDCRVWVWQGREYTEAPRAMIIDALLGAYGAPAVEPARVAAYRLPENLRAFFAARAAGAAATAGACCGGDASCCAPVEPSPGR